ncbi:MAG: VOC family protein [Deltaproteobacteria bacterium]|nr:VOC family protein [Deltaproteobacteria bacterium]
MTIKTATPYLFLDGNARVAATFYQQALGAEVKSLQTFGEVMSSCPDSMSARVVHAELAVGDATLFLSDGPENRGGDGAAAQVQVALDCDDVAEMMKQFDALAEGGEVLHPIHDTFYGGKLGALRDRFGVSWMFNSMKPA